MVSRGVRTVVFGGRPRLGPMQAIGGVKGGQQLSLRTINKFVSQALLHAPQVLTSEEILRLRALAPPPLDEFSLKFDSYGKSSVNFRNAYAENDWDTPLQFVYKAADCRLFLKIENYLNPETRWEDASEAIWGYGRCVQEDT